MHQKTLVFDSCTTPSHSTLEIGYLRHSEKNEGKKQTHEKKRVLWVQRTFDSPFQFSKNAGSCAAILSSSLKPKPVGHLKKASANCRSTDIWCKWWNAEKNRNCPVQLTDSRSRLGITGASSTSKHSMIKYSVLTMGAGITY